MSGPGTYLKLKLTPSARAPMTANGYIPDMEGVVAVVFQNTGTNNVRLFHGAWTILPNSTLALNVTEHFGTIDVLQLDVMFVGAGTNRLEILTLQPSAIPFTPPPVPLPSGTCSYM